LKPYKVQHNNLNEQKTYNRNNNTNYERFNRNNWMSNSKMHYYRCCWQSYGHLFPKMGL